MMSTVERIRAAGYWWHHLHRDVKQFVQGCDPCQRIGNPATRNHWPLTPIIPLAPFEKWGIDFIGPIFPVSKNKSKYIILATDYATKWVEARATRRNDAQTAAMFLFEQICMRFGHPLELVSDRGTHFLNEVVLDLTSRYAIKHRKTTPYNPKANGLTERANGIVGGILNKVVAAHKTDWDKKLFSTVYAYNTTKKTTTGKSPYFLVHGQEVLQHVETNVETHRVLASLHANRSTSLETRLAEIDALEEARGDALQQTAQIQAQRKRTYDLKLSSNKGIENGSLVLLFDSRHQDFPGKLHRQWMGPYEVHEVFSNGSLQLKDLQGNLLETRTNGSRVKLYRDNGSSEESHNGDP